MCNHPSPRFLADICGTLISLARRETVNEFRKSKKRDIAEPRATTFNVSPDAGPEVQNLTLAQRESIYHEAVGHDGCYKALLLFQYLFQLCPPGQQLSVQIKNEVSLLYVRAVLLTGDRQSLQRCYEGPNLCAEYSFRNHCWSKLRPDS